MIGKRSLVLLALVSFGVIVSVQGQLSLVGNSCQAARSGAAGTCKIINDCPIVIQELTKQQLYPATCGYNGNQAIICCPNPPTRAPVRVPSATSNRISSKKCAEYQDAVYEVVHVAVNFNEKPVMKKVSTCASTAVPLVVGGELAKAREFPHMALLGYDIGGEVKYECGGSLISDEYILTAAHCIFPNKRYRVKYVRLGDHIINSETDDADPIVVNVRSAIEHPSYQSKSRYNDIGLIQMERKIQFNRFIRPICLPESFDTNTAKAIATGWGRTKSNGPSSDTLLKVSLEIFTQSECNRSYQLYTRLSQLKDGIIDTQFCAGSHTEKKDTCQGDSGGPLQIYHPSQECMYIVSGVTSFGKQCSVENAPPENSPGVYTRVFGYLDWIEGIVWPGQ